MLTETAAGLTWGPRNIPVPYVATWSSEECDINGLSVRPDGSGLWYPDESPADRDGHGVLWARRLTSPGEGTPHFTKMHSLRQREAMRAMLCQVCGGPADRNNRGWLFLFHSPNDEEPGEELTTKPPMCEPCVTLAVRHCCRLTQPRTYRVRKPRIWGVYGEHFAPGRRLHMLDTDGYMPYGHARQRWFLATHLVFELNRSTRVPLPT